MRLESGKCNAKRGIYYVSRDMRVDFRLPYIPSRAKLPTLATHRKNIGIKPSAVYQAPNIERGILNPIS